MKKESIIKLVESHLEHQIKGFGSVGETPKTQKNTTYEDDLKQTNYEDFIKNAYTNYVIFRFLCKFDFSWYPFFIGHQCIENYLKAYIKFRNSKHEDGHDLKKLLKKAREIDKDKKDSFIHSDKIKYIIDSFDPYYEITRYPVAKSKKISIDKKGFTILGYEHPTRTYIIDYFVYKMKEIIPKHNVNDNIFRNKLPFNLLSLNSDYEEKIWEILKEDNINFL